MKKPIKWYLFKIIAEIGWKLRNIVPQSTYGWRLYYFGLNNLIKTGFNIYGDRL